MTTGELLKQYRKITKFFSELEDKNNISSKNEVALDDAIINAYYKNSETKLMEIRHKIEITNLDDRDDLITIINTFIALVNDDCSNLDEITKKAIKEHFFNIENINETNLKLYCDFMSFYSFENNLTMSKLILKKFNKINDKNIEAPILAIIANILGLCILNKNYQETDFFITTANQITTKPEFFFYKNNISLFKNMINYHFDPQKVYLKNCQWIINSIAMNGMPEYSKELQNFLEENINN